MTEAQTNRLVQKIRKQREKICEMRVNEVPEEEIHKALIVLKELMDASNEKLGLEKIEHIRLDTAAAGGKWLFSATTPERDEEGEFQIVTAEKKIENSIREANKLLRKASSNRIDLITKNSLNGEYL
jgi:hypothetical protein